MNRRRPDFQKIDVDTWPTVASAELDEAERCDFEARRQAAVRFATGESVAMIERATGVDRRQLYRCIERAMLPHPDGRPFGFRALVPYMRIAEYVRIHQVRVQGERGSRGAAGALSQLFERHPELAGWLALQVKQRKILLRQIGTNGRLRTRLRGLQSLHDDFLRQCRAVELTAADYPFNTEGRAIRSLSRHLTAEMLRSFETAAHLAGASHLEGLPRQDDEAATPAGNCNDVTQLQALVEANRPSVASVADHYQCFGSSRATQATTTRNIDVHYMQPALRQKSLDAVSPMVAVYAKHAGSWNGPFRGFTTFAACPFDSSGSRSSTRPSSKSLAASYALVGKFRPAGRPAGGNRVTVVERLQERNDVADVRVRPRGFLALVTRERRVDVIDVVLICDREVVELLLAARVWIPLLRRGVALNIEMQPGFGHSRFSIYGRRATASTPEIDKSPKTF